MIELRNVVKKFGSFVAVDDISLKIEQGAVLWLSRSERRWEDNDDQDDDRAVPSDLRGVPDQRLSTSRTHPVEAKRSFGYVPDQPHLYDRLTGREFLYFIGGLYKAPADEVRARIEHYGKLFEMEGFLDRSTRGVFTGDAAAGRARGRSGP